MIVYSHEPIDLFVHEFKCTVKDNDTVTSGPIKKNIYVYVKERPFKKTNFNLYHHSGCDWITVIKRIDVKDQMKYFLHNGVGHEDPDKKAFHVKQVEYQGKEKYDEYQAKSKKWTRLSSFLSFFGVGWESHYDYPVREDSHVSKKIFSENEDFKELFKP